MFPPNTDVMFAVYQQNDPLPVKIGSINFHAIGKLMSIRKDDL